MSEMRAPLRSGTGTGGGIVGYPLDRLYEEVAFLTYYTHWDYKTVLSLEHFERERWCKEVSSINQKLNGDENKKDFFEA